MGELEARVNPDAVVYRDIGADLTRFATVLVGPADAQDVVSAVVTRTLAHRRLADLENPRQYLMRAVVNEARNVRRGRARLARAVARVGAPPAQPGADAGSHPDLTAAVMELPVLPRAAVYLVHYLELTRTEAAARLGCRPAALRRHLDAAYARLRRFTDD